MYMLDLTFGIVFEAYVTMKGLLSAGLLMSKEERRWIDFESYIRDEVEPIVIFPKPKVSERVGE